MTVLLAWLACADAPPAEAPPAEAPPAEAPAPAAKKRPLGDVTVPADNPQTDAKVALGHQLFFDARLSVDGSRSCYSCHQNEDGNGGHEPKAIGAKEKALPRHSPVIWNVAYHTTFYWDGRAGSLEAQAKGAWALGNMGVGKENLDAKAAEIGAIPGYAEQFAKVFPGEGATADTVAKALAAYERTLICDDTAWDRFQAGDETALTDTQKQGWGLFTGKAGCVACHTPPLFTATAASPTGVYYNVGIGTQDPDPDVGRMSVTKNEADWAAFKVPSLRNAAKSAPYFHDGSVATLEEAVRLMATGGIANKNLTPILTDRGLSEGELDAVVAFLGALDCGTLPAPTLP